MSNEPDIKAAALWFIEQGFLIVPVPFRAKDVSDGGRIKGWQDWRITRDKVDEYFNGEPSNVGILTGDEHGTTDIDLDCTEAITVARLLLPETGFVFGRTSKPRSHYFYRSDPPIRYRKFNDPTRGAEDDKACILEIRGQASSGKPGQQTVVPPSVHVSGEAIRFEPGMSRIPANIDRDELQRAVELTAAAALLARHWPQRGARHEAGLALGGMLARGGMTLEEAKQFGRALYQAVDGHDSSKVGRIEQEISDSYRKVSAAFETTGFRRLTDMVDAKVAKRAGEWLRLKIGPSEPPHRAELADDWPKPIPFVQTIPAPFPTDCVPGGLATWPAPSLTAPKPPSSWPHWSVWLSVPLVLRPRRKSQRRLDMSSR